MLEKITKTKKTEKISSEKIEKIFNLTENFFLKPKLSIPYIKNEASNISNILDKILKEKHKISFGVGYPFYVINDDKKPIQVAEIKKFVTKNINLFTKNNRGKKGFWVCPKCQIENNLPDLKSVCKNCNLTFLKPRTFFKTLPDIDIISVVDNIDKKTENTIKKTLEDNGYRASDLSVGETANDIKNVLENINNNKKSEKKLPIDIHLIEQKDFLDTLEKIKNGEKISLKVRSLRSSWEDNYLPIWFDLIFSAYNLKKDADPLIKNKLSETLETVKDSYGTEGLIEEIKNYSYRAKKILETPEVLNNFKHRISKWNKR